MATEELKRIGVRLTADGAEDFKKELQDASAAIRTNVAEWREAQSQWDRNTSSAKKLEDRQKYLTSQVDAYGDKVKVLTTQLKEMEADENADAAAVEKKRAELANAQASLNNYEKALEEVNREVKTHSEQLKAWGDKLSSVGDKMSEIGQGLTTSVTAPIAAAGGAAVAAFKSVDDGMDIVIQKTGATGDQLQEMRGIVENLAGEVPADFETIGKAVGEVNTRFNVEGKELEELSTLFLKFADLNNTDVSSAVDNVQASMAAWGIGSENTGAVLDTLNATAQETGVDVNRLTSDLMTNAATLKEMGYSYSDAASFVANLNKNGIDVSTTMSGLKKAFANATAEGKTMPEAMAELQAAMESANTDTEAYAAALELFGNRAGPALAEAVRDGRMSFEELGTSLEDNLGSVEETFAATMDPLDDFKIVLNEAKIAGADVGSTLLDMLVPAMETLRDKISGVREWWNNLDESQQQTIIKIAGIVAAIGPLLVVGGKLTSGVGSIISTAGRLSGVLAAAGTSLGAVAGIVLIVVAAIAVLAAAFKNLWENNEEFRNRVTEIWEGIKAKFEEFTQGIVDRLNGLGMDFENFSEVASAVWDGFCALLAPVFEYAFAAISAVFGGVLDVITGLLDIFIGLFTGDWDRLWAGVQTVFSGVWNTITGLFSAAADALKGILDTILGFFGTSTAEIGEKVRAGWENIKTAVTEKATEIYNGVVEKFESIRSAIAEKIEAARSAVSTAIDKIKGLFNFNWSWPALKLPHITYDLITVPVLGTIPNPATLSVQWYKKGGILTGPTIFGQSGNTLLGGGEAGPEAVAPIDVLRGYVSDAAAEQSGAAAEIIDRRMGSLESMLREYLPAIIEKMQFEIVLDDGTLVGRLAPAMDDELGTMIAYADRGMA